MNNPESDFDQAVKHNPGWKSLWERTSEEADEAHLDPDLLVEAYKEAWNAGYHAGEISGAREASAQGGDPGARFGL